MRRYEIEIRPEASKDIIQSIEYIAIVLENPIAAEKFNELCWKTIDSLAFAPKINRIKGNYYNIRCKKYRIIYEVKGNLVTVLRVVHSSRNLNSLI